MNKETAILSIQPQVISEVSLPKVEVDDGIYDSDIHARLQDNHQVLEEYLFDVNQSYRGHESFSEYYNTGTIFMYDVISRQLEQNKSMINLTQEDMKLHGYNYDKKNGQKCLTKKIGKILTIYVRQLEIPHKKMSCHNSSEKLRNLHHYCISYLRKL